MEDFALQDNFSGHIAPQSLTNIHVINFEPNLTAHVQLNNQGIIQCFKAHYHAKFIHCAIDLYESGITPSNIYDINQLEAMRLASQAWNEVDTTTVRNCWCKAGILPNTSTADSSPPICPLLPIASLVHAASTTPSVTNNPVSHAEQLVNVALDDLVATGALQKSNWMDLEELLNPATERHNVFDAPDEDIFLLQYGGTPIHFPDHVIPST